MLDSMSQHLRVRKIVFFLFLLFTIDAEKNTDFNAASLIVAPNYLIFIQNAFGVSIFLLAELDPDQENATCFNVQNYSLVPDIDFGDEDHRSDKTIFKRPIQYSFRRQETPIDSFVRISLAQRIVNPKQGQINQRSELILLKRD